MSGIMDSHVETIEELLRNLSSNSKEIISDNKTQNDLEEIEETILQIKIEIHSVSNQEKKDGYLSKIQQYNTLLAKYRKSLLTSSITINHGNNKTSEQRSQESLALLQKSNQQLAETEAIGIDTLQHLGKQRETIQASIDKLKKTNDNLTLSNKLLNRMNRWWRG